MDDAIQTSIDPYPIAERTAGPTYAPVDHLDHDQMTTNIDC